MGNHQHSLTVGASVPTSSPIYDLAHPEKYTHSHTLNSLAVNANIGNESSHKHTALNVTFRGSHSDESDKVLGVSPRLPLEVPVYDNILPCLSMPTGRITGYGGTFGTDAQFGAAFTAVVEGATAHTHTLTGTTDDKELMDDHTHTFSPTVSMATAGVVDAAANPNYLARRGSPVSFVNDLRIAVDGFDKTIEIRDQIVDSVPGAQKPAWQSGLGNGASNHPLANEAFDAISIRLDFLPHVTFAEGQHVIELSVPRILDANGNPVPNGGRIHYNLYVE
jgi:hypothetical protein